MLFKQIGEIHEVEWSSGVLQILYNKANCIRHFLLLLLLLLLPIVLLTADNRKPLKVSDLRGSSENKHCQMIFCQIFIQCSAKREKNHWKWKQKLSAMFIRSIQRENSWHAKHSCLLMQQLSSKIKDIYIREAKTHI